MKTFNFLLTFNDGTQAEKSMEAINLLEAQIALLRERTNPVTSVISIDLIQDGETKELVKARKSKRRPSRADRFATSQGDVSGAKTEAEELRDELQNWRDNIPENLQDGTKAGELDDAISALDEYIGALEEAEGADVQFPSMF